MKKLFTLILFLFFTSNFFPQDYNDNTYHGEWRYLNSDDYFFFYNSNGEGIENYNAIPDLTIRIEKNENGSINVRLDNVIVYRYDDSSDDYNYVDVDIIVDNDDIISFNGEVRNVNENETRIYFSSPEGGPRFLDLFNEMKSGKNIYVRTTGAKAPIVFKYSLSGFSSGYNKLINAWSNWVDNNKNPFNSKNPFRN